MRLPGLAVALVSLAWSAVIAASGAFAADTFKVSHVLPKDGHCGKAMMAFAEEVTKRTEGRIRIIHDPNVLIGEHDLIESLQIGAGDFAYVSLLGRVVPEAVITDLPFLFRDYAHARAVLDGPIGQELLDLFRSHGLIGLAWGENGFRNLSNNVRPVITPEDVKGLRIRVQQSDMQIAMINSLGGRPKALPFNELFAALQQGVVDGQENTIPLILSNGYASVQRHLTLTRHIYTPMLLLASEVVWNTFSAADQRIILEAAALAVQVQRAETDRLEAEGVAMLEGAGMKVVKNIDRSAFADAVRPVYEEYVKTYGSAKVDRIRNHGS